MTCQGFRNGEYTFFGPRGECLRYYLLNEVTGEIELYELTSKNKTHPISGKKLRPVTKEIIDTFWGQICARERAILDANRRIREKFEKEDAIRKEALEKERSKKAYLIEKEAELAKIKEGLIEAEERQNKPYEFAVFPGKGTGEDGILVSRKIAEDLKCFDASTHGYEMARHNAKKVIVVKNVKITESKSEGDFQQIECKASIGLNIIDSVGGNIIKEFSLARPGIAFGKDKARSAALKAATNAVGTRLK
jgi:hypothetical protein